MNKEQRARLAKYGIDLSITIDKLPLLEEAEDLHSCFGSEYDLRDSNCKSCHDRFACAAMLQDAVDKAANGIASKRKIKYLDLAYMENITDDKVSSYLANTEDLSVDSLIKYIMSLANISDEEAAIQWILGYKERTGIKIKKGVVCR